MAPYVPAPGTLEYTTFFTLEGEEVAMVHAFTYGAVGFADGAIAADDHMRNAFWNAARTLFSLGLRSVRNRAVDLASQNGPTAEFGAFDPPLGTINTESISLNQACCVTLYTAQRGRSYRGRKYVPGIADGLLEGSYFDQAVRQSLETAYNAVIAAGGVSNVRLSIVSRQFQNQPRSQAVVTPVTLARVRDLRVDTMRSRLPSS